MELDTINWFWYELWRDGLEKFTRQGLLLISVVDCSNFSEQASAGTPAPDLVLRLPTRFDATARSHAHEDLTAIIEERLSDKDKSRAKQFAHLFLSTCGDVPEDVHDRLGGMLLGLEELR